MRISTSAEAGSHSIAGNRLAGYAERGARVHALFMAASNI